MDFLVTGGAGFIGSTAVRALCERGSTVRLLDNLSSGRLENVDDLLDRVELVEGDIVDVDTVQRAVDGVRCVLHFAAMPSVIRSVTDPAASNLVNVNGLLNVLVAARDAGVERFVFSSSSSVYGDTEVLPKREDMIPEPLSPYAAQKLAGEHYCRIFHALYGLPTFALRYFNVFGPRQDPKSAYAAVIPLFIDALRAGQSPVVYGDGEQTRDFTFVDDVVRANLACCEADADEAGGVFNIACGQRISVNDLFRQLRVAIGASVDVRYEAARPGDVRDSQADIERARERLGWTPSVSFDEGIARTVEWATRESSS